MTETIYEVINLETGNTSWLIYEQYECFIPDIQAGLMELVSVQEIEIGEPNESNQIN